MAIGSPDIVLANNPSRASFYFEDHPLVFTSPVTGTSQRQRQWGRWRARMEWTLLNQQQAYAILRVFNRQGLNSSFTIYDPVREQPSGDVSATILSTEVGTTGIKVNGANQTGQAINVKDVPNRAPSVLLFRAGDLISFANTGQMVEIYADVPGTNATTATIQLCQYLRKSPANNELINVSFVPVRMYLAQPIVPDVADGPSQFGFTAEMVEALA